MSDKDTKNKIVLIGAGNVGYHLADQLIRIGMKPVQVFSKSREAASAAGVHLRIPFTNDLRNVVPDADIYLIAISDDQIGLLEPFNVGNGIVAHTSGTVSREVLSAYSKNYGVFYPLQTFKKENPVDFSEIPVLVDGNNKDTSDVLTTLAKLLSKKVVAVTDEDRKHIHLAAVFANNFTNHLWNISEKLLVNRSISFDILVPLILKSVNQLRDNLPSALQTGPASRADQATIENQLILLAENQDWQDIYKMITLSILKESKQADH